MTEFKLGSVVHLKSSDMQMTVTDFVRDPSVTHRDHATGQLATTLGKSRGVICTWLDRDLHRNDSPFPPDCLVLVE